MDSVCILVVVVYNIYFNYLTINLKFNCNLLYLYTLNNLIMIVFHREIQQQQKLDKLNFLHVVQFYLNC